MLKNSKRFRLITHTSALLAPLLFMLAACGSLVDTSRPADERFWLEPLAGPAGSVNGRPALVLKIQAVPGLDTDRVLALGADARLVQLRQARWADSLPEVLESVLARSLANEGFRVLDTVRPDPGTCLLQIEVQEFFARPAAVHVRFSGAWTCGDAAAVNVAAEATAARANELTAVIAGFQQALDQASRDLIRQLETAEKAP